LTRGSPALDTAFVIELIAAPSSLGLRPDAPGTEPGAWRAPGALLSAGLAARLNAVGVTELEHPRYEFEMQPATRIRNGLSIREYSLTLGDAVGMALNARRFPVVVGGDCSVLLGCLVGARRGGLCGLVHVDGHCDFFHPANYDTSSRLGSVAGMDLALATGRGELLLTHWPHVGKPLVADDDVVQLGDRETETSAMDGSWGTVLDTPIRQLTVRQILGLGVEEVAGRVAGRVAARGLGRVWLHVDLDVLDQDVMPAVDSPGSPGLDFPSLAELIAALVAATPVIGVNVTIYDPDRDPVGRYATQIVDCLVAGLGAAPQQGVRR
jgi:arginase